MPHISPLTLSLACSFAAYPAYVCGIHREGARPTRPTWIMILAAAPGVSGGDLGSLDLAVSGVDVEDKRPFIELAATA